MSDHEMSDNDRRRACQGPGLHGLQLSRTPGRFLHVKVIRTIFRLNALTSCATHTSGGHHSPLRDRTKGGVNNTQWLERPAPLFAE
ncbi:hypothetical protein CDAR_42221 [Caerostris darwini]|uniref:Uncharacterized protein n=1 Tax=Caerostris darwini TaxID=1538125 RepID=A0AAV4RKI5_9ARAC|nr:hypothetical protein CDAR_42221 [Caerostris darwini]